MLPDASFSNFFDTNFMASVLCGKKEYISSLLAQLGVTAKSSVKKERPPFAFPMSAKHSDWERETLMSADFDVNGT